jgi:hypothetical protein
VQGERNEKQQEKRCKEGKERGPLHTHNSMADRITKFCPDTQALDTKKRPSKTTSKKD